MNCRRARVLAHDLCGTRSEEMTSGEQPAVMADLEQHLWSCPGCRKELEQLRELRLHLRMLGNRPAPADFAARAMSAVRRESQRRTRPVRRRARLHLRRALAAVAAAAAVVAAGALLATHDFGGTGKTQAVKAGVAPLIMEYTDVRANQPLGDPDAMGLIRGQVEQQKQEPQPEPQR